MNLCKRTTTAILFSLAFSGVALSKSMAVSTNLNTNTEVGLDTAFVGANVLNPSVNLPISDATILVSKGKIVKIQPKSQKIPANYSIVDVQDKWVIPGLIDGHIHMAQSGSAFTRPDTIDARKIMSYDSDQQWLLNNSAHILGKYIEQGITTVFDMGGPSEYLSHYRQVTAGGIFPDIYAAGTLLAPMEIPQLNINGNTFTQVTTAKEATALVVKQLPHNTKMIKMVWTQETGLSSEQLFDLYKPAIELAHKHDRRVAIHVEDLANAKMAIRAGGDILVHGVMTDLIDKEFIDLMKKNDVTYMPTLSSYSHYFELFKNELKFSDFEHTHGHSEIINSYKLLMENVADTDQMFQIFLKYVPMVDKPEAEIAKLSAREQSIVKQLQAMFSTSIEEIQKANLKMMIDAGVNVAFGTDAGNPGTLHASSMMGEIIEWQKAGISNKQILKAITFGNAVALGLDEKVGSLLTGLQANFVVLSGNPYKDIRALEAPQMTVKNGNVLDLQKETHNEK